MKIDKYIFSTLVLTAIILLIACNSDEVDRDKSEKIDQSIMNLNAFYAQNSFSVDSLNKLESMINDSDFKEDDRVKQLSFLISLELEDYEQALDISLNRYHSNESHTFNQLLVLGMLTEIVTDQDSSKQFYQLANEYINELENHAELEEFFELLSEWLLLDEIDSYNRLVQFKSDSEFISSEINLIKNSSRIEYILEFLKIVT